MASTLDMFVGTDIFDNLLFLLRIVNILIALYLTWHMAQLVLQKRGASLARTFRILALTFLVLLSVFLIRVFSVLPAFRWDVLEAFTELVFMLAIFSAIKKLDESITAYDFLSKRIGKGLHRDVD